MKGNRTDLAVEIAKILGWERTGRSFYNAEDESFTVSFLGNCFHVTPKNISDVIFSPIGRDLMQKCALNMQAGIEFSTLDENDETGEEVIFYSFGFWRGGDSNGEGLNRDEFIACALALYELANDEKFELEGE